MHAQCKTKKRTIRKAARDQACLTSQCPVALPGSAHRRPISVPWPQRHRSHEPSGIQISTDASICARQGRHRQTSRRGSATIRSSDAPCDIFAGRRRDRSHRAFVLQWSLLGSLHGRRTSDQDWTSKMGADTGGPVFKLRLRPDADAIR
jgi:hypothetical protein